MANCESSIGLIHSVVDLENQKEVIDFCHEILSIDNDLTENEDYFRDTTLELGWDNEADRIIGEAIHRGLKGKELISEVSVAISKQEYYSGCELSFVGNTVAFVYGGNE
jgi:hypothetical protein